MTPELAKAALAFLERSSLSPREIAAYVEVARALQALTTPKPRKRPTSKPSPETTA